MKHSEDKKSIIYTKNSKEMQIKADKSVDKKKFTYF